MVNKTLILTEKPSVARNIGEALGHMEKHEGYLENSDYVISWAYGHLFELKAMADYDASKKSWQLDYFPFIPRIFEYKIKEKNKRTDPFIKNQVLILSRLVKRTDIKQIISACDDDREGQIIGDIIFKMLRPSQPVYRLLLNEWTQSAVLRGLNNLRKNEALLDLRDAGISRQWADWVIGINLTAVATIKYASDSQKILKIGRVILPTLKIIYDRDREIETFKARIYYKLKAIFLKDSDAFEGIYFNDHGDKFDKEEDLKLIQETLEKDENLLGRVVEKEIKEQKINPPPLFNLTALQGAITSQNKGWSSKRVLDVAQRLYEKKLITYPRTASIALDESLIEQAKRVLSVHTQGTAYEEQVAFKVTKRIFNQAKVAGHSAIMPTYLKAGKLDSDELIVYFAIKNRFIKQFLPPALYEKTNLVIDLKGHTFKAGGRVCIQKGWQVLDGRGKQDNPMPEVKEGEDLVVRALNTSRHETQPPLAYTEKTLLKTMETCGKNIDLDQDASVLEAVLSGFSIGTAATRADIIEKLVRTGYIHKVQSHLKTTDLGRHLIEIFPVKTLMDLEFTGRLEKRLEDVAKGLVSRQTFLKDIFRYTGQAVDTIKTSDQLIPMKAKPAQQVLGTCPACGGQVVETPKSYSCNQWRQGCKYVIWKNDKFFKQMKKKPTKTMVKSLLKNKRAKVKGFTAKSGNKFDAFVYYELNQETGYYQWRLEF